MHGPKSILQIDIRVPKPFEFIRKTVIHGPKPWIYRGNCNPWPRTLYIYIYIHCSYGFLCLVVVSVAESGSVPYEFIGFGAIGFGAMKGCFIYAGFGAMECNFPYDFIGFGATHTCFTFGFIGFRAMDGCTCPLWIHRVWGHAWQLSAGFLAREHEREHPAPPGCSPSPPSPPYPPPPSVVWSESICWTTFKINKK